MLGLANLSHSAICISGIGFEKTDNGISQNEMDYSGSSSLRINAFSKSSKLNNNIFVIKSKVVK